MSSPFVTVLAASAAFLWGAQPTSADVLTRGSLLTLIAAADVDAVEVGIAETRMAQSAGDVEKGRMRDLIDVFDTTSPNLVRFAVDWRKAYPESAAALSAEARTYLEHAFVLRGDRFAHLTHVYGLRAFDMPAAGAADRALAAYAIAPDFLPASDILFLTSVLGYGPEDHAGLTADVMAAQPNETSLTGALFAANRGWSGSVDYGMELCERHGDAVPSWGEQGRLLCALTVAARNNEFQPWDWVRQSLDGLDHPQARALRAKAVQHGHSADPKWRADLDAVLSESDMPDLKAWQARDQDLAYEPVFVPLSEDMRPRAIAMAEARLAWDPHNLDAIANLTNAQAVSKGPNGGMSISAMRGPAYRARQQALLIRRTEIQPWNALAWSDLAAALRGYDRSPDPGRAEDARIKAIVFSNHAYRYVRDQMRHHQYAWERTENEFSGCAASRALLVLKAVCEVGAEDDRYNCGGFKHSRAIERDRMIETLTSRGTCVPALSGPIETLAYGEDDFTIPLTDPLVVLLGD